MTKFAGYPWRFVVTDLTTTTTTWAEGLFTNRKLVYPLNASATIDADVWPDDRRVNLLFDDSGYPLIGQSNRLIYAFRREDPFTGETPPWIVRGAGIIMGLEDQADVDVPLTHLTAYDPWTYLGGRPVMDVDGGVPGPQGLKIILPGNDIIGNLIAYTRDNVGPCFIDTGPTYGGTAFWGTTTPAVIETCETYLLTAQQGNSVADIMTQLTTAGNLDIVLYPVYDPGNRPGITHDLAIYQLAGEVKPKAVFAWDQFTRSLKHIDRMHSAVPGDFFNTVLYYSGQGGPPAAASPLVDTASVADFTTYWSQQSFPNQVSNGSALLVGNQTALLMAQALQLVKQGRRTMTVVPMPERSPVPFLDYVPGDRVPLYATNNLRVPSTGVQRVNSISITVEDDGVETVDTLLLSPDWRAIASE